MRAITDAGGQKKTQKSIVRKAVDDESGFTLVEIIAVLVILGILAAVAVPKYFDLQTRARVKAAEGAVAEGIGRINQRFGDMILSGTIYSEITYHADDDLGTNMGDFTLSVLSGGGAGMVPIVIEVTGRNAVSGAIVSRSIPRPGRP